MSGPVHVIGHLQITDERRYRMYADAFMSVLEPYDANVVTVDDNVTVLEGGRADGRTVIIRFASEEECLRWWNSDEYRAIAEHRIAGTNTISVSLVHALPT